MLASAGLQMSQPRPMPNRSITALKVVSPDTRTASKSWRRDMSKCSHSALLRAAPDFASSVPTIFLTIITQEPQAAPALVQDLMPATSVQPSSWTAWRIVPAVTLLHEQTSASSGSSPVGGGDTALGHEVGRRVAAQRAADERAERSVRRGIAHEDAAEQRLRIVRQHELLVDARDRVRVDDVERAGRRRERVAEARDIDARELELGGEVVAGERRLAAEQPRRGDLGHRVAGCDEPDAQTVEVRHLADREDPRVGCSGIPRRSARRRAGARRGRRHARARPAGARRP